MGRGIDKSAEIAHLFGGDCQRLGIVMEEKLLQKIYI